MDLAGGPLKSAWLDCDGQGVFHKKFERRHCVLWPRNFRKLKRAAPSLFLWESDQTQVIASTNGSEHASDDLHAVRSD
jgi:hypothetical protein